MISTPYYSLAADIDRYLHRISCAAAATTEIDRDLATVSITIKCYISANREYSVMVTAAKGHNANKIMLAPNITVKLNGNLLKSTQNLDPNLKSPNVFNNYFVNVAEDILSNLPVLQDTG